MAHGIGTLFGGIIIGWIYAGNKHKGALILGGIFTFFGLVNIILIPHPIWMVIADLCIYIPMAVIGKNLGLRLT